PCSSWAPALGGPLLFMGSCSWWATALHGLLFLVGPYRLRILLCQPCPIHS
ncbi:hypothetical protein ACJMK2_044262, partial [Sinanodonta woodiana]